MPAGTAPQSVEAVAQVALTRVALRWPEVEQMANPRGYLYTIAANLVRTAAGNRPVLFGNPVMGAEVRVCPP